jgi:hypothetical protein
MGSATGVHVEMEPLNAMAADDSGHTPAHLWP